MHPDRLACLLPTKPELQAQNYPFCVTELQTQNYLFCVIVAGGRLRVSDWINRLRPAQRPATNYPQPLPRTGRFEFVVTCLGLSLVLLAGLASCARPIASPSEALPGSEQEVLRAEHAWVNSTIRKDADAFASFMHDGWVGLSEGRLIQKAEWTNSIRAQTVRRDSVQLSNLKVRFPSRDVAVVTGSFVTRSRTGTGPREFVTAGTYMNNWVRIGGRWQIVSSAFATILKSP